MGQPTGWDAQPHGWESGETPASWLEESYASQQKGTLIVSNYLSCKVKDSEYQECRERALSIYEDVYLEWCLEFFSMMYFDKRVDRTKLMMEKCIWFRLCGVEKVLTLPEFVVLLGLYEEDGFLS
ncbi:hypothetical protein Tco_0965764 [Tanacetum coccineum]